MTTLRRNLRLKFEEIILSRYGDNPPSKDAEDHAKEVSELLADAAFELLLPKPKFDFSKAGMEWSILAGIQVDQSVLDATQLENNAIDAFESAFSIKGNWNWYPAKPQDERVWKKFREFVVKLYLTDKDSFTKYVTWIAQPYSRGAMTGLQIKRNPQDFPDAWASFCMATKYQAPRVQADDADRDDLDANGIPLSY